jgi:tetratricopeptide (TPR) repeat protein
MLLAQKGDTRRGREYLQKAVKLSPQYPEALNNLGVLYVRDQQLPEATVAFQECIRVAPEFDEAYLNMARVYVALGKRSEAREILRQLLERHPNHPVALKMVEELTP